MASSVEIESNNSEDSIKSSYTAIEAASAPILPLKSETSLKPQISAPSYFYSLRENDTPPFLKPVKEPRPKLIIGTVMNKEEAVQMIAAADADRNLGLKQYIGNFLVEKQIIANFDLREKTFLISFLSETIDYGAQHDFNEFKLSTLLSIYIKTHLYFKWYYWQSPAAVWNYFKEIMVRHTIEDSPDGQEVFEPEECYDIMSHFHTMYLSNLPLVHILTFGTHRVKLGWPFKPKV